MMEQNFSNSLPLHPTTTRRVGRRKREKASKTTDRCKNGKKSTMTFYCKRRRIAGTREAFERGERDSFERGWYVNIEVILLKF